MKVENGIFFETVDHELGSAICRFAYSWYTPSPSSAEKFECMGSVLAGLWPVGRTLDKICYDEQNATKWAKLWNLSSGVMTKKKN